MCPTTNHMTILKVLRVSMNLIQYSNTIDTNPFIHRSSVHCGVKHIGMQKVNYANTQMKPISLNTPNHMAILKVLRVSLNLIEYSNTIDTNLFIHRSSVHRGVKHIGMQKVNYANTQMKPISLNFLNPLYPRRKVIAITEYLNFEDDANSLEHKKFVRISHLWKSGGGVSRGRYLTLIVLVNDFSEYTRLKSEIEARAFQPNIYSRPCPKVKEEPFNTRRKEEILRNNLPGWLEEESRLYSSIDYSQRKNGDVLE